MNERKRNPYIAGRPLNQGSGFFGRGEILNQVKSELRNSSNVSLVLFGQRRIGKTSLLYKLKDTLPLNEFIPVYFDLQDRAKQPLGQLLADLAQDTIRQINFPLLLDPNQFDDQGHFFQKIFLPQLYKQIGIEQRLVFLIDEFDVLDTVDLKLPNNAAANAFFAFLRQLMVSESRLVFVFVVGRKIEDLSGNFQNTFRAGLSLEVWTLDKESTEALIRQAEENNTLSFTNKAINRIFELTSGHPFLTQLLCQRIWEKFYSKNTEPSVIEVAQVDSTIPNVLETGEAALIWLWEGLSPAEKIYISALAGISEEDKPIPKRHVEQILTEHDIQLLGREDELAPQALVKWRILAKADGNDDQFYFSIKLLHRWIRENKPLGKVREEVQSSNVTADRLYKTGKDFYEQKRYDEAVRYLKDALVENEYDFRALPYLGLSQLKLGNVDEAIAELEKAYLFDPDHVKTPLIQALLLRANSARQEGNNNQALALLEKILKIDPENQSARQQQVELLTIEKNRLEIIDKRKQKFLNAFGFLSLALSVALVLIGLPQLNTALPFSGAPGSITSLSPTPPQFSYLVRVFDNLTGDSIQDARITLEWETGVPLMRFTDSNGLARLSVDTSSIGHPAILTIEKAGYEIYRLNVDLYPNQLPAEVRLSRIIDAEVSATPVSSLQQTIPSGTSTSTSSLITPTSTPSPKFTALSDWDIATAVLHSSIFVEPNSESEELAYLEPGDEVTVIGITANRAWLLVRDDNGREGFVVSSRVEYRGNPPTLTPSPTPWASSTPPAAIAPTYVPLSIDFWELTGTGRCAGGQWHKRIYIRGQGGDLNYTYYYFNDVDRQVQHLAERHDDSFTFEVAGTGTTALRLTGEVHSGDGQTARRMIVVEPQLCP